MPSAIKRRLEHPRSTAQEDLLLAAAVASDVNHSRFTLPDLRDALQASGIAIPGDLQHQLQQLALIKCVAAREHVLYRLLDPIGREPCQERVGPSVLTQVVAV